jgi:protein SCO1
MIAALLAMLFMQTADAVMDRIGIDQRLGADIDLNLVFRDETGAPVRLGAFFGRRPVIVTPVYYDCPMLCTMQLNGLVRAMRVMPFSAGREFEIVTFSFDPKEGPDLARSHKDRYVRDYGRAGAAPGWHFLTGDSASIEALTRTIGFRYAYDTTTGQWAHVSAILVLTPAGRVSQYLNGIEHDPQALKFSLIEASGERIGTLADHILLFCFQYNPHTGKYSLVIMRVVQIASVMTVLGIGIFMLRNGKR